MEYNKFDGRQLQIDQKEPHECNKVCRWWWLASLWENLWKICVKKEAHLS